LRCSEKLVIGLLIIHEGDDELKKLLVILLFGALFWLPGCQSVQSDEWVRLISPFSITSEGASVVEYEDQIFYFDEGIWCYDFDTGRSTRVLANSNAHDFAVADGYVYYFESTENTQRMGILFRTPLAGGEEQASWNSESFNAAVNDNILPYLETTLDTIGGLYVLGDCIAFKDSGVTSIAYSPETGKLFRVGDPLNLASQTTAVDDQLYFIVHRDFRIFQKPLSAPEQPAKLLLGKSTPWDKDSDEPSVSGTMYDGVIAVDNALYFTQRVPAKLWKYAQDGNHKLLAEFSDENGSYTFLKMRKSEKKLYYKADGTPNLYCYDPSTDESKLVYSDPDFATAASDFVILKSHLFYWKSVKSPEDEKNPSNFVSVQLKG
jgi:hypothetical protein